VTSPKSPSVPRGQEEVPIQDLPPPRGHRSIVSKKPDQPKRLTRLLVFQQNSPRKRSENQLPHRNPISII
jgi:hypothetical protein